MFWYIASALSLFTLFGVFTWMVVHTRKETWIKTGALILFVLSLPIMVGIYSLTLGMAYPIYPPLFNGPTEKIVVRGMKMVPLDGIYLFVDRGSTQSPITYRVVWDPDLAKKLKEIADKYGDSEDGSFTIRLNPDGDPLWDRLQGMFGEGTIKNKYQGLFEKSYSKMRVESAEAPVSSPFPIKPVPENGVVTIPPSE